MEDMADTEIKRISGTGADALYDLIISGTVRMAGVPMDEIIKYFESVHEDEGDNDG